MADTGSPGMVLFAYISFALGGVLVVGGCIYMIIWAFCNKCLPCGRRAGNKKSGQQVGHAKYMDKNLSGRGNASAQEGDTESLNYEGHTFLPRDAETRQDKGHTQAQVEAQRRSNGAVVSVHEESEVGMVRRASSKKKDDKKRRGMVIGAAAAATTTAVVAGATTIIISEHDDDDVDVGRHDVVGDETNTMRIDNDGSLQDDQPDTDSHANLVHNEHTNTFMSAAVVDESIGDGHQEESRVKEYNESIEAVSVAERDQTSMSHESFGVEEVSYQQDSIVDSGRKGSIDELVRHNSQQKPFVSDITDSMQKDYEIDDEVKYNGEHLTEMPHSTNSVLLIEREDSVHVQESNYPVDLSNPDLQEEVTSNDERLLQQLQDIDRQDTVKPVDSGLMLIQTHPGEGNEVENTEVVNKRPIYSDTDERESDEDRGMSLTSVGVTGASLAGNKILRKKKKRSSLFSKERKSKDEEAVEMTSLEPQSIDSPDENDNGEGGKRKSKKEKEKEEKIRKREKQKEEELQRKMEKEREKERKKLMEREKRESKNVSKKHKAKEDTHNIVATAVPLVAASRDNDDDMVVERENFTERIDTFQSAEEDSQRFNEEGHVVDAVAIPILETSRQSQKEEKTKKEKEHEENGRRREKEHHEKENKKEKDRQKKEKELQAKKDKEELKLKKKQQEQEERERKKMSKKKKEVTEINEHQQFDGDSQEVRASDVALVAAANIERTETHKPVDEQSEEIENNIEDVEVTGLPILETSNDDNEAGKSRKEKEKEAKERKKELELQERESKKERDRQKKEDELQQKREKEEERLRKKQQEKEERASRKKSKVEKDEVEVEEIEQNPDHEVTAAAVPIVAAVKESKKDKKSKKKSKKDKTHTDGEETMSDMENIETTQGEDEESRNKDDLATVAAVPIVQASSYSQLEEETNREEVKGEKERKKEKEKEEKERKKELERQERESKKERERQKKEDELQQKREKEEEKLRKKQQEKEERASRKKSKIEKEEVEVEEIEQNPDHEVTAAAVPIVAAMKENKKDKKSKKKREGKKAKTHTDGEETMSDMENIETNREQEESHDKDDLVTVAAVPIVQASSQQEEETNREEEKGGKERKKEKEKEEKERKKELERQERESKKERERQKKEDELQQKREKEEEKLRKKQEEKEERASRKKSKIEKEEVKVEEIEQNPDHEVTAAAVPIVEAMKESKKDKKSKKKREGKKAKTPTDGEETMSDMENIETNREQEESHDKDDLATVAAVPIVQASSQQEEETNREEEKGGKERKKEKEKEEKERKKELERQERESKKERERQKKEDELQQKREKEEEKLRKKQQEKEERASRKKSKVEKEVEVEEIEQNPDHEVTAAAVPIVAAVKESKKDKKSKKKKEGEKVKTHTDGEETMSDMENIENNQEQEESHHKDDLVTVAAVPIVRASSQQEEETNREEEKGGKERKKEKEKEEKERKKELERQERESKREKERQKKEDELQRKREKEEEKLRKKQKEQEERESRKMKKQKEVMETEEEPRTDEEEQVVSHGGALFAGGRDKKDKKSKKKEKDSKKKKKEDVGSGEDEEQMEGTGGKDDLPDDGTQLNGDDYLVEPTAIPIVASSNKSVKEKKSKKDKRKSKNKEEKKVAEMENEQNEKEEKTSWFGFRKSKRSSGTEEDSSNVLYAAAPIAGTAAVGAVTAAVVKVTSDRTSEHEPNVQEEAPGSAWQEHNVTTQASGYSQQEEETSREEERGVHFLEEAPGSAQHEHNVITSDTQEDEHFNSNLLPAEHATVVNKNLLPTEGDSDSLLIADSPGPRARSSPILYEEDEYQDSSFGATGEMSVKKELAMRDDEGYQTHDPDGDSSTRDIQFDKSSSGEQRPLIENDDSNYTRLQNMEEQRKSGLDMDQTHDYQDYGYNHNDEMREKADFEDTHDERQYYAESTGQHRETEASSDHDNGEIEREHVSDIGASASGPSGWEEAAGSQLSTDRTEQTWDSQSVHRETADSVMAVAPSFSDDSRLQNVDEQRKSGLDMDQTHDYQDYGYNHNDEMREKADFEDTHNERQYYAESTGQHRETEASSDHENGEIEREHVTDTGASASGPSDWEEAAGSQLSSNRTEQTWDSQSVHRETAGSVMAVAPSFTDELQASARQNSDNDEELPISKSILADIRQKRNLKTPIRSDSVETNENTDGTLFDELHTVLRSKKKEDRESAEIAYDVDDVRYTGNAKLANEHLSEEYDTSKVNVRARASLFEKITENTGETVIPSYGGVTSIQSYIRPLTPTVMRLAEGASMKSGLSDTNTEQRDVITDAESDQVEYHYKPSRDSLATTDHMTPSQDEQSEYQHKPARDSLVSTDLQSYHVDEHVEQEEQVDESLTNGHFQTFDRNEDSFDEPLDAIKHPIEETDSVYQQQVPEPSTEHYLTNGHSESQIDKDDSHHSFSEELIDAQDLDKSMTNIKVKELNRIAIHDNFNSDVDVSMVF